MISVAQLPVVAKEPLALLGLDVAKQEPDTEFTGFGFGRLPELTLASPGGDRVVRDALVFALHTPDEPTDDLELEFWLEEGDEEIAVLVPFDSFAEAWIRPQLADETAVVLAMCNPGARQILRPTWLGPRQLHYAQGDVASWLDPTTSHSPSIRLQANHWLCAA